MNPERRNRVHIWIFSTWQWAVLGAYAVAICLSVIVYRASNEALNNTERIDRALCAQIRYLEGVRPVARPEAKDDLSKLLNELRPLVPSCPPPRRAIADLLVRPLTPIR